MCIAIKMLKTLLVSVAGGDRSFNKLALIKITFNPQWDTNGYQILLRM